MQLLAPEVQMTAMLEGSIYTALAPYVPDPERIDIRKFITVNRQNLIDFLSANLRQTEDYFEKHSHVNAVHDVETISRHGDEYVTAWMDHGQPTSIRRFKSLAEAVAEHVLVSHGLY